MDNEPKKILILHASAGDGHKKAAEAMGEAAKRLHPAADVVVADALDYVPGWFKKSYAGSYLFIIHRMPWLWGLTYDMSDNPLFAWSTGILRRVANGLFGRGLERMILSSRADVVYSAHFMVSEVCAHLKRNGMRSRTVSVITDFLVHRFWVFHETDAYAVASDKTKEALLKYGIAADRIHVTGIPVGSKFARIGDRAALAAKIGVRPDLFTLLLTSGGAGTGPMKEIVGSFLNRGDVQVLAVAGRNQALAKEIAGFATGRTHVKVFGFVSNMDELMDVSDVVVGKAGGLTTSEALAKRKPFLILCPVPGQETRNAEFLTGVGAAVWIKEAADVVTSVDEIKSGRQKGLLAAIDGVRRPDSAEKAVQAGALDGLA